MENKTSNPALPAGRYFKYAFGEIILVVIGILIALQINNWNENRKLKLKEASLLKALNIEFTNNKKQLNAVVSIHQIAYANTSKIVNNLPFDITKLNYEKLSKSFFYLIQRYTFNPSQGTIISIISSSSFDIISNEELRQILISRNDVLLDYQEEEIRAQNYLDQFFDPYIIKYLDASMNFDDPLIDLSKLNSKEFENILIKRERMLYQIIKQDSTGELIPLQQNIERIISLTASDNLYLNSLNISEKHYSWKTKTLNSIKFQ